jgi:hypothetical protein|tara:strand:+ start:389 stop:604 length:216 start_codon:yes stop_codon:yes gene_type:complete
MKPHYIGSVAFDNHNDVWQDELVMAFDLNELVEDMQSKMESRRNSEVFFAAYVDKNGREVDITQKVKEKVG